MKQLILFRHAKSSWDLPINDIDRDLLQIGIDRTHKTANQLSLILKNKPQKWYSSPAKRAFKTSQIALSYFEDYTEPIEIIENLYTFSYFDLLKIVKNFPNDFDSIIIFGHNEGFTEFINRMGNQYLENLPTSGVAIIDFDIDDWNQIQKGNTKHILKPKDL